MARKQRSDEDLVAVSEHLFYEITMLYETARILAESGHPSAPRAETIHNALLESFVIHTRNLIDFFYSKNPSSDAVIAEDFFESGETWLQRRPALSQLLKTARIRAHKEAAHLTYKRLNVTPEQKGWEWTEIAAMIGQGLWRFLELVPDTRISDSFGKLTFRPVDEVRANFSGNNSNA